MNMLPDIEIINNSKLSQKLDKNATNFPQSNKIKLISTVLRTNSSHLYSIL